MYIATDTSTDYLLLQDAYDTGSDGNTIKVRAVPLVEDLYFSQSKSIFMDGGYDCSYTHNAEEKTILNGSITIDEGIVTIGNFILE